jgi:phage terminase large subunit GpA-like protein
MATAVRHEVDYGPRLALAAQRARRALAPPPFLSVSEWADRYRIVPSYSAEPGRWVTDKTPYLREVQDNFSDPHVTKVVFMKPARIGATEAGLNIVGYFIDHEPSPIFIVQPSVEDAKDFSKEQLTPTIEETPVLREKVASASSRDSGNTIQAKIFRGGGVYLVGANSPRGFRRRTARIIILEEVDAYPESAGVEGDQVALAERRATTFGHRRKVYLNSTPTIKGASRIEREWEASDQRHYLVACLSCHHEQMLVWGQLHWQDLDAPHYTCTGCGVLIPEREKTRMVATGRWVASNPGPSILGYHINALYSPWVSWTELRDEFLAAKGDLGKLQVFVNTALGESWEDRGSLSEAEGLESKREAYESAIPTAVQVVTIGVDVQPDRLEAVVRGWGPGEESWLLDRLILLGDSTVTEATVGSVWQQLESARLAYWAQYPGRCAMAIDSGYNPEAVYRYAKPRWSQKVFVTRGYSQPGKALVSRKATTNNKARCRVYYVGTDAAKDSIFGRLRIATPGPLYWHFPMSHASNRDYFEQLTSEKRHRRQLNGRWVAKYESQPGRRNEVLDCEVGNLCALVLLNPKMDAAAVVGKPNLPSQPSPEAATTLPPLPPSPEPLVTAPKRKILNLRPKGSGFSSRW